MKRHLLSILPIVVSAALWSAPSTGSAQDAPLSIQGRVQHLDGRPVAYASVALNGHDLSGATNVDGAFEIRFPRPGPDEHRWVPGESVTIRVQLDGYDVLRPWDGELEIPVDGRQKPFGTLKSPGTSTIRRA